MSCVVTDSILCLVRVVTDFILCLGCVVTASICASLLSDGFNVVSVGVSAAEGDVGTVLSKEK